MGDEIEAVTETAKAVQEVAKTGRALIEPGTDLAHYVARVLGTVPEDVVGFLLGDPLHELRQHTLTGILRAAFEKLRKRGVETAKPIRPRLGKEAFEAASLETDETLQDMWAELLANSMDPNRNVSPRRVFIDTLSKFEPPDAVILLHMGKLMTSEKAKRKEYSFDREGLAKLLKVRTTEIDLSLENLVVLKCVSTHSMKIEGIAIGGMKLTSLGFELYHACNPDAPD